MKGVVTLATSEGPRDVEATLTEHLAVHKPAFGGRFWVVTHRASGLAMEFPDRQRDGIAFAEKLEREYRDDLVVLARLKLGKSPSSYRGKQGASLMRLRDARTAWRALHG